MESYSYCHSVLHLKSCRLETHRFHRARIWESHLAFLVQLHTRHSPSLLLQWFCPPVCLTAHWEHQHSETCVVSVQQFIKLSWSRDQEAATNSTCPSKQTPAMWMHLQHLLLTDVMFSDILSWIMCIIYSCASLSPRLQDNDHIFRFYTGFHSDFWLKGCWKKGVFADILHIHDKFDLFHCWTDVCFHMFEKSHQAKNNRILEQLVKQILTLICHSSTSLSLRFLASSRSAILAVYSASSVACWIIKWELQGLLEKTPTQPKNQTQ